MRIVLPFRGELGITIRFHVPTVAAMPRPLIVCHEPGLEALYPDCVREIVPRLTDSRRVWRKEQDASFKEAEQKRLTKKYPGSKFWSRDGRGAGDKRRFIPEPFVEQVDGEFDVFVCPRKRETGAARNWDLWPTFTDRLRAEGLSVFAGGMAATSYDVNASDASWNYLRTLDACIEAMKRSRVVVATDAGLAHLALLCGRPLVLIGADGGRCAPGNRIDEPETPHWPVRMKSYYREANHCGVPLTLVPDGWTDPDAVFAAVEESMAVGA